MKKIIALLLAAIMMFGMAACAAAESTETSNVAKLDITIASQASLTGMNVGYEDDALYQYVCDKFGINITEIYASGWDVCAEKENMWITSGSMPDSLFWSMYNLEDYRAYVDQGFFQALPDNWEERWPNIAKMTKASGISELLKVDGKTYGIPHSIYGNFLDVGDSTVEVCGVFFRTDWAEQVGMPNLGKDGKMTLSELKEYLQKVGEAGLCRRASLAGWSHQWMWMFWDAYGMPAFNSSCFVEGENGFEYIPAVDGYVDWIQEMQDWYETGLIDKDIYNSANVDYLNLFLTGQIAAYYSAASPDSIDKEKRQAYENLGGNKYDIGVAAVSNDNGEFCKSARTNLWGLTVFNPDIDIDALERILDVQDWIAGTEGAVSVRYGVPGENWKFNEDGTINKLNDNYTGKFADVFVTFGYCDEDFAYSGINSALDPVAVDESATLYKYETSGKMFYNSDNYALFMSPAKDDFSIDIDSKIMEIVCDGSDVETSWAGWLEETSKLWKPLLDELNAEYYG